MTTTLKRELGTFGAVMMGLGSIVGTGVFVSVGIAAGVTGPAVVLAVMIGAVVATFNGLSSAQLAASHPVSGGTYEYGYRYLNPVLGFSAGWLFMSAKSASAATAALGCAGYVLGAFGIESRVWVVLLALVAVASLTGVVLAGLRRSNVTNIVIVSITLASLVFFILAGLPSFLSNANVNFAPFFEPEPGRGDLPSLLYASALMFVAYTGYGRIATLGEEVREPQRTIPRAIIITLLSIMVLYALVALISVGAAGVQTLSGNPTFPLEAVARTFSLAFTPQVVLFGAITAMLGVLLNLILGLSRVLLAMGRRGDMPRTLGELNAAQTTPTAAVLAVGVIIAGLTLLGDVRATWSFSAFTVLLYYAITNLAALRLPQQDRRFPRWISVAGLLSCASLAFFVEPSVWLVGLGLLAVGLLWHVWRRQTNRTE